ncbi:MAG TPA: DUF3303 family protein [Acidobacteriota bacterium]|nr:DUF3303 family protein [Acidobacteriota bacterium]
MLYMIIENYKEGAHSKIYKRLAEKGRMMPPQVTYIDSWVETNFRRCFQLMEAPNRELLDQWISNWKDLVDFEVLPVMTSKEAQQRAE